MILILLVLFVAALAITKYMSVGSILLMVELVVVYILFGLNGLLCFDTGVFPAVLRKNREFCQSDRTDSM